MTLSPTAEGFRATLRQPSFTLAEIAWRWTAGATAAALFVFGAFQYLDTLPVSKGDALFLRTRHPYLVSQALAHIFHGSMPRAVAAALLAATLVTLLWIGVGSLGRAVTVRSLLNYFRENFRRDAAGYVSAESTTTSSDQDAADGENPISAAAEHSSIPTLLRLNFLRAVVALAAIVGLVGAAIIAGFASPDSDPQPGLAFLLFLGLAAIVFLIASSLNWFLSLAGLFAVRDGESALAAMSTAVAFFRERTMPIFGVSLWTGIGHLIAFVGATMVVSFPIGLSGALPGRVVMLCVLLITLAYFAVADWLYMARLAGYVCIAEMPEALLRPPRPIPPPPPTAQRIMPPSLQTTIDKDEPILSDM